jgi:O-acetylhomoserine/O-acetylserine sulfhydrylase-like pyridoxal-dependent enzyme
LKHLRVTGTAALKAARYPQRDKIRRHSDVIAGLVAVNSPELAEKIKFNQNSSGAILAPFDSWLTIRGIETLALRAAAPKMRRRRRISQIAEIVDAYYPDSLRKKSRSGCTAAKWWIRRRGFFHI